MNGAELHLELADKVMLADHERRIRIIETVDKWALRILLFLAALKFFGIENAQDILRFFGHTA